MADPDRIEQPFDQFAQNFMQQFRQTMSTVLQEQRDAQPNRPDATQADLIFNTKNHDFHPKTKIDFPRFESGDPTEWLYKINKYFEYYKTSEESKLSIATLHLDWDASSWFQWLETNHQIRSWHEFTFQMHIRFGPSPYEDPNTQLSKLCQTGSIAEYEAQFQKISNKIPGLPESFLKGCYIGGLKWDIQCEVISAQPYNLQHAIGLSKVYEGKAGFGRHTNLQPRMHYNTSILGPRPTPMPNSKPSYKQALVPYTPTPPVEKLNNHTATVNPYHKLPIKRLSAAER